MITAERSEELHRLWNYETDEEDTQQWRDELTDEEQELVAEWDLNYARAVSNLYRQMLVQGDGFDEEERR